MALVNRKLIKHKLSGGIKRAILVFYKDAFPLVNIQKPNDPEMLSLYPYCKGLGVDVGCGSRKTHPDAIGIDLVKRGNAGKFGSERRQMSQADIRLSGDDLYIFADDTLDYVVSRHTIEHFKDPKKAIIEWKRVLKRGGVLGLVVPDDEANDTKKLDPTHFHAFTKKSFRKLLEKIGGFNIEKIEDCVPRWSFTVIAKKK